MTVAKVNVDENATLAPRFNIHSIPTLIYFKGGEERDRTLGMVSKKEVSTDSAMQARYSNPMRVEHAQYAECKAERPPPVGQAGS